MQKTSLCARLRLFGVFWLLGSLGLGCTNAASGDGSDSSGGGGLAAAGAANAGATSSGGAAEAGGGAAPGAAGSAIIVVGGGTAGTPSTAGAGAGGAGGAGGAAGAAGSAPAGGAAGAGGASALGPRQKMLDYIASISGKKTLAGEHNREASEGNFIQAMHDVTGHFPALWGGDFLFETNEIANRPKVIAYLMQGWKGGAAISLMYHACSPAMGEACSFDNGIKAHLSDAQWADLTTDGGALNKVWKARLDAISPYLQQLKDAGIAPILRIHHEMNQGVFWWAGRKGPTGTAKLFQITHDYLVKTKGFDNIVWVWSVQDIWDDQTNSWNFDAYNPGAAYWDIMALDFYDGKGFTTDKYNAMLAVAGNKPITIGECTTLPTSKQLTDQPRWLYFLGWSELTQQSNSNSAISSVYTASNVLTQDEMPGW